MPHNNCFNLWINQRTQVSDANLQELQLWHTIALKNPPPWKHTWALRAATTYEFFHCCKSTQLKLEIYTTLQHLLQICLIKIKKPPFSRLRKGKARLTLLHPTRKFCLCTTRTWYATVIQEELQIHFYSSHDSVGCFSLDKNKTPGQNGDETGRGISFLDATQ